MKRIEALEKQKAKKPERNLCPCCNRILDFSYNGEYCDKCGQRLDWSDFI